MPDRYIESHIRRIPLFQNLTYDQLKLIASAFVLSRYEQGEIIFSEGDPTQGLMMFVSGQAVLMRRTPAGQNQVLGHISAGQFISQQALFADGVETATLQVAQTASVLVLSRLRLRRLLANHNELKIALNWSQHSPSDARPLRFQTQRDDEEVILYTRRHWWAYVRLSWLALLAMGLLWVLAAVVQQPFWTIALFVMSLMFPGLILIYLYLEWRNDAVIITDQRVIRVTHTILTFSQEISEVSINSIHEANAEIPGHDPFARLFRYGSIELKTAGQAGNIILDFMHDPEHIQEIILEDQRQFEQRQAARQRSTMRAELERWLNDEPLPESSEPGRSGQLEEDRLRSRPNGGLSLRTKYVDENGGIIYRKHLFVWFKGVLLPTLLMLTSVVLVFIGGLIPFMQELGLLLSWALSIFGLVVGALWFYWADWDWRNDLYIIGDSTITMIHRRPLWLQSENDQVLLERVDNVVSESSGIFNRLMNFGDVRISLVGADQHKVFDDVPEPLEIQAEITRRQARLRQQKDEHAARQQREMIGEYLSLYHDMQEDAPAAGQPTAPTPEEANPTLPVRPAAVSDRSRPPGVPRRHMSGVQTPSMSPGRPYDPASAPQPDQQTRPRPPHIPRSRNQG